MKNKTLSSQIKIAYETGSPISVYLDNGYPIKGIITGIESDGIFIEGKPSDVWVNNRFIMSVVFEKVG